MATLALQVKEVRKGSVALSGRFSVAVHARLPLARANVAVFIIIVMAAQTLQCGGMLFVVELDQRPLVGSYFLVIENDDCFLRKSQRHNRHTQDNQDKQIFSVPH
jgi:hypothetical protein